MEILNADKLIDGALRKANSRLGDFLDGDVIFLKAPMAQPVDDNVRREVEAINETANKDRLIVVLETRGGFIEVVERIVGVFRKHYQLVDFIVPNYAYSAGTVLVMSGDEIYMDYHSILGPIDPQYESETGDYMPGMGYLAKYEELMETINKAPSTDNVRAEIAYLIQRFDPAKLYHIEHAIEHSKSLLRNWLPRYKFKDWSTRETSGEPVTDADKEARANEIAEVLGEVTRWHSHGRGITLRELRSEEIRLKIKDFGGEGELDNLIRDYYSLISDYTVKRSMSNGIHTQNGLRRAL